MLRDETAHRAGAALVILGVADIGLMLWAIQTGRDYSSSLNVFAVIGGMVLMRGGDTRALVIRGFATFFLATILVTALTLPLYKPLGLIVLELRHASGFDSIANAFNVAAVLTLAWVAWTLQAVDAGEVDTSNLIRRFSRPPLALLLGASLGMTILGAQLWMRDSAPAIRARQLASEEATPDEHLWLETLSTSTDATRATLMLYTDTTFRRLVVRW